MKNPLRWLLPARKSVPQPLSPREVKSFSSGSVFALHGQGAASWSSPGYASLARVGYMRNPIVYRCVRLISEAAANVSLLVYDGDQEQDNHPLLDLMARPNRHQSRNVFLETIFGHLLVSGNAYIEKLSIEDQPRELHALRPDRMRVIADSDGWPTGFEHRVGGKTVRYPIDPLAPSPILHMTMFHPQDDHYGFPPLQAALMALDVHNSANQWNKSLLDNSARPSGALIYAANNGANLTQEQFDRLKSELEEGYTGAEKAGRPMLLEGGLDWKAMAFSPKDLDFAEAKNGAAREIALAFGIPPMLLGIPGDNTYSNYREANRALWRQVILPLLRRTLGAMGGWLGPHYGGNLRIDFDIDRIEELAIEREALWKRVGAADFISDDEKRLAVGYSPRRQSPVQ